jgi:flagellar biosynthesis protein FlhF
MKIKRFFAPDMRTAIRQVRDEQGPDAVILSTRKVDGGIEIVSAMNYDPELVGETATAKPTEPSPAVSRVIPDAYQHQQPASEWNDEILDDEPEPRQPAIQWAQDPAIVAMRQELNTLRDLMQHQMEHFTGQQLEETDPVRAQVKRRLTRYGVSDSIAYAISRSIRDSRNTDNAWREALYGLASKMSVTDDDIINKGGIVALVGSTGVGKTTTIAKLAARFCMRHNKNQLALITTDNYRVGAEKQLSIYGQILGVPVHQAKNTKELLRLLKALQDKKLVLIDTAGMSQHDRRLKILSDALTQLKRIRVYLVAAANTQGRVIDQLIRNYGRDHFHASILTKLDEAASLGEPLSVLMEHKLPLAYLSDGQGVPEHLKPARVSTLVGQLVATGKSAESVTEPMQRDNLKRSDMNASQQREAVGA